MFQMQGETFDKRLASVADLISQKKNIVVLAGAGISVSCGIPDFRSKDGLYNNLNYQELGLTCAEDLFDLEAFTGDPRPFYKFVQMNNFASETIKPSTSHFFLAWLDQRQMLLRIYTQNIDGLEQSAGVNNDKIVYAHGSFASATCMKCKGKYQASDIDAEIQAGSIPVCHRRITKRGKISSNIAEKDTIEIPPERRSSRKRSCTQTSTAGEFHPPPVERGCCGGIIKPNITFFGEKLDNNISRRLEEDYKKADALIVMGTSLSVAPMSRLVGFLPDNIPRILINRDIVQVLKSSSQNKKDEICLFDACLLGNCDAVTQAIKEKICNINTLVQDECHSGRLVTDDNNGTWLRNQSRESVLLFDGALLSDTAKEATLPSQNIVVHCDHCENEIKGDIFCCKVCFDFDLCRCCYPKVKLSHADGEHEFEVESR